MGREDPVAGKPGARMPATDPDATGDPGVAAGDDAEEALETGGTAGPAAEETPEALRDRWLRAEAELQNFRRRARRELEEVRRATEDGALLEVISFLDDGERALEAADASGAAAAWSEGVRLVMQRMRAYLTRMGVETMDPVGQPFDPTVHEAVLEMEAPENLAPGHVIHVVRKGYRRDGRALRPARVVVSRAIEPGSSG